MSPPVSAAILGRTMTGFGKGIVLALTGAAIATGAVGIAYPQGAVTLVQVVFGGSTVSTTNPFPVTVESGGPSPGAGAQPYNYTPQNPDQHNLAIVSSTALTIPTGTLQAVVCARGNNVNYTYDGVTTPTTTVGMPLAVGQCLPLSGALELSNFLAIQVAPTATLDVAYTK